MNKFWILWVEGSNMPVVKHYAEEAAKAELDRLSTLNIGKRVILLESTYCIRSYTAIEEIEITPM